MADQMKPTPRSTILGLFSDVVNLPLEYMSSPERTQQMQGAAQFLYGTGIPKTLERMSYGDSLFTGSGMTLRPKEETINAAMNVAPFAPVAGRVLPKIVRATEGMPVGMSIKDVGKGITSNISQFTGFKNTTPYGKAKEVAAYLDRLNIPYTINKSKTTNSAYLEIQTGKGDFDYPMQFRFSDHSTDLPHQNRQIFTNPKPDPNFDLDVFKDGGHDTEFAVNKINELVAKINPITTNPKSPYPQQAELPVGATGLPSPQSLTMPSVPTVEQMGKYGRTEVVPLSQAVSFQSARNWEKFNAGKGPGDLVAGYGDKPLALRLETGEYVIYDGNHRTDLALQKGQTELPMYVIDVKSYDPTHAGRKPVPPSMTDDELLSSLLGDEVNVPPQTPTPIESPAYTDPFGNTIGSSIR